VSGEEPTPESEIEALIKRVQRFLEAQHPHTPLADAMDTPVNTADTIAAETLGEASPEGSNDAPQATEEPGSLPEA
jgi:hypothetical protein